MEVFNEMEYVKMVRKLKKDPTRGSLMHTLCGWLNQRIELNFYLNSNVVL